MRRRPRPGVTAAPTTAALATGACTGDATAAVTTAALATGAPTTPTRPTRAALSMSGSCLLEGLVGLQGGDDRLDGDPAVGDQLTASAPGRGCERRSPEVLVDEDPRDAARIHRVREVRHIVGGEELREVRLHLHEVAQLPRVLQFHGVHGAVLILHQDDGV